MESSVGVIIVAGGSGKRCGAGLPKQFRLLGNRPVLARTIDRFAEALPGAEIVVVLPEARIEFWRNFAARFEVAPHQVVVGGAERFHSVLNGLQALKGNPDLIAIQDGVRPLGSNELILRVAQAAEESGAAIPALAPVDSFRMIGAGEESHPVDRSLLRIIQTPQIFRAALLIDAYRRGFDPTFTDDASVVEAAGYAIRLVEGERSNLKLTTAEDFVIAEALLAAAGESDEPESESEPEPAEDPAAPKAPKTPKDPAAQKAQKTRKTSEDSATSVFGSSVFGSSVTDGGWR